MRVLIGLFVLTLSVPAWAADDETTPVYIYGTYMYCDIAGQDAADATFEKYGVPVYKASMESGAISGWGYLKHHAGGEWRRLVYHMGPSIAGVISAGDSQGKMMDESLKPRDDNLSKACRSHDDYIWENMAGNSTDVRGKVGLSIYMVCDMTREARADDLIEKEFKFAYDGQIKKGNLTSWGWLGHVFGGNYRRVLTLTADDNEKLFAAREELLSQIAWSAAGREFTSICGTHQDYLWDIAMEGR